MPTAVAGAPDGSSVVVGTYRGTLTVGDLPTPAFAGQPRIFVTRLAP